MSCRFSRANRIALWGLLACGRIRASFREGWSATKPCPISHAKATFAMTTLRIGLGEDSHRMAEGGPLRLGGVEIEFDRHLVGHSDADALLHAVTDALLGAASKPDIGELFPNSDVANRRRDSAEMLRLAYEQVTAAGYAVVNLDCVVAAERPRLSPHKDAIRDRIAEILEIDVDQVNLKAKTGEGVGAVGRGDLIQARCIALIERR